MSRQQWLKDRRSGVGASESAALFGLHPYMSALSLYESKISEIGTDDEGNERMEDGKVIEPRIAVRYTAKTGNTLFAPQQQLYTSHKFPRLICSPDRLRRPTDHMVIPVELKWWDNFRDGDPIPEYGQIQLQHQMAVLDAPVGDLAILGSFRSFHVFVDIERHDPFIEILAEKVATFWKCVENRTPPDADGSDATKIALRKLYPRDRGTTIFLPPESAQWSEQLASAKAAAKEAATLEAEAYNKIIAAIGENSFGTLPDGTQFSYKTQKRSAYTVEAGESRVLRRVKK